jgi:hypothetical protein
MSNALIALQLILQNAGLLQEWSQKVAAALAEGRDLTDAELDSFSNSYSQAHATLDSLIAQKSTPNTGS